MANIPISSLPEVTTISEDDYLAVDNGTASSKIKVSKFNEESTSSAYTYMTRAETAATNAADSASAALGYKNEVSNLITSAQTVVSDAQTYAGNAATSAGSAADSASTATTKANAAAASASQAASYANNVDSYAKEAKSWARGGTGTRIGEDTDNAMYYANEAKSSETNASVSETNAASSESNAASSESNAATSESNASASATSANTNALKAEGYAVGSQNGVAVESGSPYYQANAKYYKEDAANSASTATTKAGEASGSASTASSKAIESQSWAVGGTGTRTGEDTNNAKYWSQVAQGAAGGGVSAFNGRSGAVVPVAHDYNAGQIDYDGTTSGLQSTDANSAIDEVYSALGTLESGLGSAAALDVATSGDASTTQVVKGDDSRLTDARTPVSHTHTVSQITDFPTLGTAAAKNSTNAVTQSSTDLVESGAVYTELAGKENKSTIKSAVLTAGNTTVTFTQMPTTGTNLIKFYNDAGINFTAIDKSVPGQVTLTFDEQASNVNVYCEIKGVA